MTNLTSKSKTIKELGASNHEAVAFDTFGNAYLTEDRSDGLFYKYTPSKKGDLNKGQLFALAIRNVKNIDTRNWDKTNYLLKDKYKIIWIPLDDIDPEQDTLRFEGKEKGALIFARGEGIINSPNSIYFSCTSGGLNQKVKFGGSILVTQKMKQLNSGMNLLILITVDIIGLSKAMN